MGDGPERLHAALRLSRGPKPWVWQVVTDRRFEPLTRADDDIELLVLPDAAERILHRAEARDRLIVAWTEHELNVVKKYCPQHLARFEQRYVNARAVAVHWRNACHGGRRPASNELADYLALIGYEVADAAGPGRAGETIRLVGAALEKGTGSRALPTTSVVAGKDSGITTSTTATV